MTTEEPETPENDFGKNTEVDPAPRVPIAFRRPTEPVPPFLEDVTEPQDVGVRRVRCRRWNDRSVGDAIEWLGRYYASVGESYPRNPDGSLDRRPGGSTIVATGEKRFDPVSHQWVILEQAIRSVIERRKPSDRTIRVSRSSVIHGDPRRGDPDLRVFASMRIAGRATALMELFLPPDIPAWSAVEDLETTLAGLLEDLAAHPIYK